MEDLLRNMPPLLQVVLLAGVGIYVTLSLVSRFHRPLAQRIWDPERSPTSRDHLIEYTVLPALVFLAGAAVVVYNWDSSTPWLGTWSASRTTGAIVLGVYALSAMGAAHLAVKRIDISNARRFASWIPLLVFISGLAAIVGAVVLVTRA